MKKLIVSLSISVLCCSCGENWMCGANQTIFSDVTSPRLMHVKQCDENQSNCKDALDVFFIEQSRYPDKDVVNEVIVNRVNSGGTVYVWISDTPDFSRTLIEQPEFLLFSWGNGYAVITRQEQSVQLIDVKVGTTVYVKFQLKENSYQSERQMTYLPDDSSNEPKDTLSCDGQYVRLETKIIPQSVSCLETSLAGIAFCRYNDTEQCVIENQSDNTLTVVMTIPERQSTLFQELKLSAGENKVQDCKDLKVGDEVNVKVWRWSPDTLVDNIKTKKPSLEVSFTFTNDSLIKVDANATSNNQVLNIQRTLGTDCSMNFNTSISYEGRNPTVDLTMSYINNSNDDVSAKLYLLKSNPITAETYVIDYELAQLDLKAQATKDVWIPTNEVGVFLLRVQTTGWISNSNLSANQPFRVVVKDDGWQVEHLDNSAFVK